MSAIPRTTPRALRCVAYVGRSGDGLLEHGRVHLHALRTLQLFVDEGVDLGRQFAVREPQRIVVRLRGHAETRIRPPGAGLGEGREGQTTYVYEVADGNADAEPDLLDHRFVNLSRGVEPFHELVEQLIGSAERLEGHDERLRDRITAVKSMTHSTQYTQRTRTRSA